MTSAAGDAVEIELKLGLVDPSQLPQLLAVLAPPRQVIEQRNHYLVDDHGVLAAAGIMVRVRESCELAGAGASRAPAGWQLTAKRRTQAVDGVFVAEEHEQTLPRTIAEAIVSGGLSLSEIAGAAVEWIIGETGDLRVRSGGRMVNQRQVIDCDGFVLEVDRTSFPDGSIDAEVEVETADTAGARRVVERVARAAGVELFDQQLGKYARFLGHQARG